MIGKNNFSKMPNFADKLDDFLVRYLAYFNYRNYVKEMNLKGNEKILEVGCGGGNLSRFLVEKLSLGELVCVDSSKYWIDKAKNRLRNFGNIEFKVENVLDFKRKNYFDVVVVHYVLHDISREQRKSLIKVLNNSLKDSGEVYIREPAREKHGISPEEIKELMLSKGFLEKFSIETYSLPLRGKIYKGVFRKYPD